ncbi:MAG: hypothetical protein ACRDDZ_14040 [Marinifilaceae bacterium]
MKTKQLAAKSLSLSSTSSLWVEFAYNRSGKWNGSLTEFYTMILDLTEPIGGTPILDWPKNKTHDLARILANLWNFDLNPDSARVTLTRLRAQRTVERKCRKKGKAG